MTTHDASIICQAEYLSSLRVTNYFTNIWHPEGAAL
jgi:hypothetical protein